MTFHDVPLPFDLAPPQPRKRVNVPRTSVLAYQATNSKGRMADVVRRLIHYQRSLGQAPTSAELAMWMVSGASTDAMLFYRRGLSDAKARGLVRHCGKRTCRVAGTLAVTWKVVSR